MTMWVLQIMAATGLLSAQANGVVNYVQSLPPRPNQSEIKCRDAKWEAENLTVIAGSKVHKKLIPFVKELMVDAQKNKVPLEIAVAYRSCDYQLNLRKLNCGLGNYNLYQKPGNQCTPPTEPPGKSLHNEGLAIDFSCQGYALIETSPCYFWLKNNAPTYQLYEHPQEPWHWSTTGK